MAAMAVATHAPVIAMAQLQHDEIEISEIKVGDRFRKELGDVAVLAESIQRQGLLQPIGVTDSNELVFGERRLRAFEYLGWSRIPVRRVSVTSIIEGEHDENEIRKDFTPSERVAIAKAVEEALGERRGGDRKSQSFQTGQLSDLKIPETRDIAAAKSGFTSGKQYERAKAVVTNGTPELVRAMDDGKVSISNAAASAKLPEDIQRVALATEDPNKSLREAVLAIASTRPQAASNRNPIYKPDAGFNALASVTGACDSISEKIEKHGPSYLAGGAVDDAMRSREKATILHCIENLKALAEVL